MLILIVVLFGTLSLSNGNEFAGDRNADTSTVNAHIHNGVFETRRDHFRPQYFDKVQFVCFVLKKLFIETSGFPLPPSHRHIRPIPITIDQAGHCIFISKMHETIQQDGLRMV